MNHASPDQPVAPAAAHVRRRSLFVPTGLLGAIGLAAWMGGAASASCDYSARFSLDNLQFQSVQVVTAFPAVIDPAKGTIKRVCGAPLKDENGDLLPGETDAEPNGLELTVNLVSTDLNNRKIVPKCPGDRDFGIKEGERIEFQPLSTSSELATIAPGHFKMELECFEGYTGTTGAPACAAGAVKSVQPAKAVKFRREALRCDKADPETWQNVAVVVDHSGSTSGFISIDQKKCDESTKFAEDLPGQVVNSDFKACASDPHSQIVEGAKQLIDALNAQDRVLAIGFSEKQQVYASCTDDVVCQRDVAGTIEIKEGACTTDNECAARHGTAGGWRCGARPDQSKASVPNMPPDDQLTFCWGNAGAKKAYNKYGIEVLSKYEGTGRSAVYESIQTAYDFLKKFPLPPPHPEKRGNAKHIVLLTDGPDTCTPGDNFTFTSIPTPGKPGGQCRKECSFTTTRYRTLLAKMAQDGFPVHVHVIQMQSRGKLLPDPTLQELACRSEGTFQMINSAAFNRSEQQAWIESMARAILKIRYALAGSWRVGFVDNGVKSEPKGQIRAVRGRMKFSNNLFVSLESVFKDGVETDWRFEELDSQRDARLTFRVACKSNEDCGGGSECGIGSCSAEGMCRAEAAPDLLPCGPNGKSVCCKGVCAAKCDGACK